ncbi:hypothetical protein L917_12670 [Phytophthora nicotianae]|uniref:Anaphase-promoting complex subunit 4 WD40 domain-containing protein n=1 Tax=Phytophthora nicotianae TaxID=4792 RepID=W2KUJ1_PHYNI|nr:hypothetical protein L917_12670 [Phytophthora nicotianae]
MANLAQQLARLQLGALGGRHRPTKRLNDAPPISANVSSISLQHSSVQRALLASLHSPAQRVLALGDGPEAPINGQTTGYSPSGPIFQVDYAHTKKFLVAVDEEGAVGIVDVAAGRRNSRWMAHHNAVFDVIWTQDDTQVLTAAGDLEIRIWDVQTAGVRSASPVSTLRGHDMSVKCVRQAPDNAHVFASGGRDGRVLLWDTRAAGKPISSLDNVHAEPSPSRTSSPNVSFTSPIQKRRRRTTAASSTSPSPRSVTCVEFSSTGNEIITAGAVDAVVKFWDLRRLNNGKKKATAKVPTPIREISCSSREGARRGISSLALCQRGTGSASHLLVNVLNDSIAVVDFGQQQARTGLRCAGHQASSFYCKAAFSPEGNFIAGSSADGVVYVWDARLSASHDATLSSSYSTLGVQQRMPCFALKGHTNEVNGVAWSSQDFTQLASCSDDGTVRCWQVCGQETSDKTAQFELQLASDDSSDGRTEWTNWNEFTDQPDGYAYRVRSSKRPSRPLSPRRQRVTLPDKQRASPQVTRRNSEPRLHPVHEIPTAQQPQQTQDSHSQPKRIKLRRKAKSSVQPKRAQRTLLELWGR